MKIENDVDRKNIDIDPKIGEKININSKLVFDFPKMQFHNILKKSIK